jgi:hypothetical protein
MMVSSVFFVRPSILKILSTRRQRSQQSRYIVVVSLFLVALLPIGRRCR